MQEIIASVDGIVFDVELALEQQLGAQTLPFPGMDSKFHIYIAVSHMLHPLCCVSYRIRRWHLHIFSEEFMYQRELMSLSSCCRREAYRLQALASRLVQEERPMRIPSRIRFIEDA